MTTVLHLKEQLQENTILKQTDSEAIIPYMNDGEEVIFVVKRGKNDNELCLKLHREGCEIKASGSYFVGIDWIKENKIAIDVSPKMNLGCEIDYVNMLNEALHETDNFLYLKDLITIHFDKTPIKIKQQQDLLSIFLITEYLNLLQHIVKKGLKKSYYSIEENLKNKVKERILIGQNINKNISNGNNTDNVCRYQIYDIDTAENRILKKAYKFCIKQLSIYNHAFDTSELEKKVRLIKPYLSNIGDDICIKTIKSYKGNPLFKEYNKAVKFAQLLLHRYSYDISIIGKEEINTPPFWIDMSKLFELYVYRRLKSIFCSRNEIQYHVNAHYQELDYLLKPTKWSEPYVIDAKYKPKYKDSFGISIEDAREICGYARLSSIYKKLGLNEDIHPPIKCLIIYPDQDKTEQFTFSKEIEPEFEKINGYVRLYKVGIKLPTITPKHF